MTADLQIRAEDWERNWALASTDERIRAHTDLLVAVRDEALESGARDMQKRAMEECADNWRGGGSKEAASGAAACHNRIRALKVKP